MVGGEKEKVNVNELPQKAWIQYETVDTDIDVDMETAVKILEQLDEEYEDALEFLELLKEEGENQHAKHIF